MRRIVYFDTSKTKIALEETQLINGLRQKNENAFRWLLEAYRNKVCYTVKKGNGEFVNSVNGAK